MIPGKPEPRFDLDYAYGRQGELMIGDFLTWIASGNGQVEVKRKRYLDLEFYIETSCDKGRTGTYAPSGVAVTTAAAWAFLIGDTGIAVIVPTELLRSIVSDSTVPNREERDGSCPTRGKLMHLGRLLAFCRKATEVPRVVESLKPPCPICGEPGCIAPHEDEIKW